MKIELDLMDARILEILQEDARVTLAEIGRRIHLSQPAVAERIRRMETAQVITGYHARVNPEALGYGITAFVRIASRSSDVSVPHIAAQVPEVVECHAITGEDCVIVKVVAPSVRELERVIASLARGGVTSTSLILSSSIERRAIKPVE
ncbi:Lrp/AsnC family transcriptional regulator [Undibacterium rugosum]|uniref:Lrp/AsnC family transcriptional regulator n=2 Tax=Undibacterium TaxID=401469 RepID=A0A923KYS2_9BURK|nr:Lrp/AsnC family transcriptional regulator [Undibacterium rugosum]MBC3933786.1 Lrp/AsnC family transcriptional regulator [Undibacterium rugosum]MBR7777489.1 Lrp/AsnC family transcriptional regulator [Undibacterium rugosum]